MKKATLSIGLLTLMMILTSFTSPIDGSGGQSSGGNRKVDFMGSTASKQIFNADIDGSGGQSSGGNRKVD